MGKKRKHELPELPETGRFWLNETQRIRLQSPGIQRYPGRRRGVAVAVALALAAVAWAAARWLLR